MKQCGRCKLTKDLTEFNRSKARKDGCQGMCRSCQKEYDRKYYQRQPTRRPSMVGRRRNNRRKKQQVVWDILKSRSCVDCGEADPIVLDFDHRDPATKESNISQMLNDNRRLSAILTEIAKCDVRCANCHRRRTADQFNWYAGIVR